jgi:hypothetical protein
MRWAGFVLGGLVVLFMLMDSAMKFHAVPDRSGDAGAARLSDRPVTLPLAVLLAATLLYAYPRTALLGAILLTAYLGGAVATHVRVGSPLLTHTLFGAYLGVVLWGGLYFRDARVRALLPLRR